MSTISDRIFARVRARDLARELELDIIRARALTSDLVLALDLDINHLDRDLILDIDHDIDRARVRAHALELEIDHDIARNLDRAHDLGRDRAAARANGSGQPGARRVAPAAASLLTTAARLLPAAHRSRYAEEYRSELWDLAQAGAGRIRQLRYALCQFRNVVPMSVTLRSPRRRSSTS
jgi:hypothetical protein